MSLTRLPVRATVHLGIIEVGVHERVGVQKPGLDIVG